ncbi:MAG: hypothetical protein ACLTDR_08630 [Adlercreutzia equolifaciens]
MSAASYSRTSRPRTDRVSYDRSSAGRAGAASGYRGARYVSSSLAEELSFEEAPSISVVPGAGRRAQSEGISTAALSLAKACAVICIVIALIAMARVAITSAAASCALFETRSLQTSIETARAEGNELEVSQSVLANPSRIKAQATALGMAAPAPEYSEQITLSPRYRRHRWRRQPVAVGVGGAHEGALIPWNATATPTKAAAAAAPMPAHRARPRTRLRRAPARLLAHWSASASSQGRGFAGGNRSGRPSGRAGAARPGRPGVGAAIDAAMPTVSGRAKVLLLAFAAIAAVFFLRLVFLQVIVSDQYSAMAEESRTVSFETTRAAAPSTTATASCWLPRWRPPPSTRTPWR